MAAAHFGAKVAFLCRELERKDALLWRAAEYIPDQPPAFKDARSVAALNKGVAVPYRPIAHAAPSG